MILSIACDRRESAHHRGIGEVRGDDSTALGKRIDAPDYAVFSRLALLRCGKCSSTLGFGLVVLALQPGVLG